MAKMAGGFSTSVCHTDVENPLESLCPRHRHMALGRRFLILTFCNFLAALAPLGRCHQRTVFAVRGEYTVKTCQIASGLGHQ